MIEQVEWCIKKLEEALADYNMTDAKNYTELLKQWLTKQGGSSGHSV